MGLVSEISDALRKGGQLIRKGPELVQSVSGLTPNTKSMVKGAKDSTFQYKVLITNSVSTEMATTTARLLDQKYACLLQQWLSMNSMFDVTVDPNPLSYLKRFHQNIKFEDVQDFCVDQSELGEYLERVQDNGYKVYMDSNKTTAIFFGPADHASQEILESHREMLDEYLSQYNLTPIEPIQEADDTAGTGSAYDLTSAILQSSSERDRLDRLAQRTRNSERAAAPRLLDRDVKRTNDLTPYAIQVRLMAVNDKKEFIQYVDFIVGVKAVLNLIPSEEMISNIARALQNRNLAFKFLRWTTGEISLLKDIILNLDEIKMDSIDRNNNGNPYFAYLKKLKNRKIGIRNLTVPHKILPTATIVISSYEVDFLKNKFAIDLREPKVARKLLDSLFIMAFIILDEDTNTLSIFDDGDTDFQVFSMEVLERDTTLNSNRLGKEIGRMITSTR